MRTEVECVGRLKTLHRAAQIPAWDFHYEMRVFHQAMQIPGQIIATQAFRQLGQGPLTILIPVNESLAFGAD